MGTGLAINVITKSGGNSFRGTAAYAYQPLNWSGDNTGHKTVFALTAARRGYDLPEQGMHVNRRHARAGRHRSVRRLVRRADQEGPRLVLHLVPQVEPSRPRSAATRRASTTSRPTIPAPSCSPSRSKGYQPYVKVTSRLGAGHELSGFFQRDRTHGQSNWNYYFDPINVYSNGGNVYSAKLTSAWGVETDDDVSAGYNNKSGNDNDTYRRSGSTHGTANRHLRRHAHLERLYHGQLPHPRGRQQLDRQLSCPRRCIMLRGDLTYYKDGWMGIHEFGTGFFIEPQNIYDQVTDYVNDGFFLEDPDRGRRRQSVDGARCRSGATTPDPISLQTRQARDSNYAFYCRTGGSRTPV